MGGSVAFNPKGMEEVADFGIEADFAVYLVEQVGLRGLLVKLNSTPCGNILRQRLAELPKFEQRGIGI